jgi:hypothetical protein
MLPSGLFTRAFLNVVVPGAPVPMQLAFEVPFVAPVPDAVVHIENPFNTQSTQHVGL